MIQEKPYAELTERCPDCGAELTRRDSRGIHYYDCGSEFHKETRLNHSPAACLERRLVSVRLELQAERFNHKKDNEFLLAEVERLRDVLQLILLLARGYAQAHPVGSNQQYVEQAAVAAKEEKP